MMMRFPGLGGRAMAAIAPAAATSGASGGAAAPQSLATPDAQARATYLQWGYRPLLAGSGTAGQAAPTRQLLVDISGLVERDARTGIQRVVRNLTRALASLDLPDWRVEPIYAAGGVFRYARRFSTQAWQLPELGMNDDPVRAGSRDVFFTADVALLPIAAMHKPLRALRDQGVPLNFVLHDLIPVFHPEFYQGEVDPRFARWLQIVFEVADGVWCVSNAVARELESWLARNPQMVPNGLPRIGFFHLGAEIGRNKVAVTDAARAAIRLADATPQSTTLLMVGTLEPRKGHEQVLDACELLWADGQDVNLLIIGKVGWNVKPLVERLRAHPQAGQRLCWLDNADDATLAEAYASASALMAASYAEGFGLPLIEAAQHGLPIIARDLPVFREVAGPHAWYFQAARPSDLAAALRQWMGLRADGLAPPSRDMPHRSWEQSARRVAELILPGAADPPG